MNKKEFEELCRTTCLALHSGDLDNFLRSGEIEIDGINFGLYLNESEAPDRIICYIDLGPVSPYNREGIMSRLLALNVISGTKTAGVYGMNTETDRALFIQQFLYPELLEGEEFSVILKSYACHAKHLQKNLLDASYQNSVSNGLRDSLMQSNSLYI